MVEELDTHFFMSFCTITLTALVFAVALLGNTLASVHLGSIDTPTEFPQHLSLSELQKRS